MSEYIEREATYKDFEKRNNESPKWSPVRVKTLIALQKAADVAPVRHGWWHDVYMSGPSSFTGTCSACGVSNDIPYPTNAHYCPNCGAKMDGNA